MKFIIDQQLPHRLTSFIRRTGHEAEHVAQLNLSRAGDGEIWRLAVRASAVVGSKDDDFNLLVRTQPGATFLWVRTGNCSRAEMIARLEAVWSDVLSRLEAGAAVVEVA